MYLLTHFLAFCAGGAIAWYFKGQILADYAALHNKIDALIDAGKK